MNSPPHTHTLYTPYLCSYRCVSGRRFAGALTWRRARSFPAHRIPAHLVQRKHALRAHWHLPSGSHSLPSRTRTRFWRTMSATTYTLRSIYVVQCLKLASVLGRCRLYAGTHVQDVWFLLQHLWAVHLPRTHHASSACTGSCGFTAYAHTRALTSLLRCAAHAPRAYTARAPHCPTMPLPAAHHAPLSSALAHSAVHAALPSPLPTRRCPAATYRLL